jgi:hypothetical protein
MHNNYKTKEMSAVPEPTVPKSRYDFPEHGISVEAESYEEALKLLKEKLKK